MQQIRNSDIIAQKSTHKVQSESEMFRELMHSRVTAKNTSSKNSVINSFFDASN